VAVGWARAVLHPDKPDSVTACLCVPCLSSPFQGHARFRQHDGLSRTRAALSPLCLHGFASSGGMCLAPVFVGLSALLGTRCLVGIVPEWSRQDFESVWGCIWVSRGFVGSWRHTDSKLACAVAVSLTEPGPGPRPSRRIQTAWCEGARSPRPGRRAPPCRQWVCRRACGCASSFWAPHAHEHVEVAVWGAYRASLGVFMGITRCRDRRRP